MTQIDSPIDPFFQLRNMDSMIRSLYNKLRNAKQGDVEKDKDIRRTIEAIAEASMQLEFSFMRKLLSDASYDQNSFEKLEELEELLNEMIKGKGRVIQEEHYFFKKVKNVRNQVRKIKRKTKHSGRQELSKVKKEKKALKLKEKEAKEKAGKKAA